VLHTAFAIQPRILDRHLNVYLWLLLSAANLVDVLASRRAFGIGMVELNPIVDLVLVEFGVWGVSLLKAFWLLVLYFLLPHIRGWTQALLTFASLAYFALTLLHLWHLSPLL
jgi:hypothetical protein